MASRRSSVSFEGYEVIFDLMFQVPIVTQHFQEYLRAALNEEGFLFVSEVLEYKKILPGEKTQIEKAKYIIEEFVCVGAPKEINVEGKLRKAVISSVEERKESSSLPVHVFDECFTIVYRELQEDGFPRYRRSDEFLKFLNDKGEELLKSIAIDLRTSSPRNAVRFQPNDFNSGSITDRDIQFILRLNQDTSDWKRIYHKDDVTVHISRTNYTIGGMKGLRLAKQTGFLPCSVEEAVEMRCIDSMRNVIDLNCREMDFIRKIQAGDNNDYPYSFALYNYGCDIGPLFHRRNFTLIGTTVYDTERQCYVDVAKTAHCYSDLAAPFRRKKHPIIAEMITGFTYYRIGDNKCRYVHVAYSDFQIPKIDGIFERKIIERGKAYQIGLMKLLNKVREEKIVVNAKEHPRFGILEEYKDKFMKDGGKKTWDSEF